MRVYDPYAFHFWYVERYRGCMPRLASCHQGSDQTVSVCALCADFGSSSICSRVRNFWVFVRTFVSQIQRTKPRTAKGLLGKNDDVEGIAMNIENPSKSKFGRLTLALFYPFVLLLGQAYIISKERKQREYARRQDKRKRL